MQDKREDHMSVARMTQAAGQPVARHYGAICSFSSRVPAVRQETNQSRNHKNAINVYDRRVWGEINYLDSSTDYREYLEQPTCRPAAPELELLDDQRRLPWVMIAKSASLIAIACVVLLIVTLNS
jgi:hypothetical protein